MLHELDVQLWPLFFNSFTSTLATQNFILLTGVSKAPSGQIMVIQSWKSLSLLASDGILSCLSLFGINGLHSQPLPSDSHVGEVCTGQDPPTGAPHVQLSQTLSSRGRDSPGGAQLWHSQVASRTRGLGRWATGHAWTNRSWTLTVWVRIGCGCVPGGWAPTALCLSLSPCHDSPSGGEGIPASAKKSPFTSFCHLGMMFNLCCLISGERSSWPAHNFYYICSIYDRKYHQECRCAKKKTTDSFWDLIHQPEIFQHNRLFCLDIFLLRFTWLQLTFPIMQNFIC